jgi:hypothetical protein
MSPASRHACRANADIHTMDPGGKKRRTYAIVVIFTKTGYDYHCVKAAPVAVCFRQEFALPRGPLF